ncbi:MAG: dihydroxyacetone kinase subunit DhaL [Ardenticatenaceae bacterium]|nr:dihydroxyacetone kinase subunit DhaL [Ardenticatenaceae bacterium]
MATTTADTIRFVEAAAATIAENSTYLTRLDAAIGDADHGANMERGFRAVLEKLPGVAEKTPADVLKLVGMTLVARVGGAGGPLYGTAFMQAGMAVQGKGTLDPADVVAALAAALKGVVNRGKAEVGDKTMVDALTPAVAAAQAALEQGDDLATILGKAAEAARSGMESTIPLVARKGRASYLGERSAGHQDPGATSSYLLLKTLAAVAAST